MAETDVRQVIHQALSQLDDALGNVEQKTHVLLGPHNMETVAKHLAECHAKPDAYNISNLSQSIAGFLKAVGAQLNPPLFQITNKHVADCGQPSPLPADFGTGPYYRSYFENEHGEQWVFWFNYDTKELHLRGGDCGWDQQHKLLAVSMDDVASVLVSNGGEPPFGNILPQVLLAGQHKLQRILGNIHLPLIFAVDKNNHFVTLSGAEHVWLQACVQATRVEIKPLSAKEFRAMVAEMQRLSEEASDEDDGDDDEDGE